MIKVTLTNEILKRISGIDENRFSLSTIEMPPATKVIVIRLRCFVPTYLSQPSLIRDFCPSDQRFAYSFLQIPPRDEHPCCPAIYFPLSGRIRDLHPLERAHDAQTQKIARLLSF